MEAQSHDHLLLLSFSFYDKNTQATSSHRVSVTECNSADNAEVPSNLDVL